jgi:hypothetical protein
VARSDGAPPREDEHRENYAIGVAGGERGPEENYSGAERRDSVQAVANGKDRGGSPRVDVELLQDVQDVVAGGALADR